MKELRGVPNIGKQSSGKSYLLNRIFGPRIDVTNEGGTDGIGLAWKWLKARRT
jgi:hypothetical protein